MSKHFDGMSKYTATKRPLRLVYFESFKTRTAALIREKEVKKMKSRKYIENLITEWRNNFAKVVEEVPTCREKVCIRETVSSRFIGTNPLVSASF